MPHRPAFGPKIEALIVYNSNPVAVAPESPKVVARLRARRPVHRRARTLHDRHRRPCRLRAARHHSARAPGRPHQLRPHLRDAQRARDRAARRGQGRTRRSFRELAARDGPDRRLLRRRRRDARAHRVQDRSRRFRRAARTRLVQAADRRRARSHDGNFPSGRRPLRDRFERVRRARLRAQLRIGGQHARARGALSRSR